MIRKRVLSAAIANWTGQAIALLTGFFLTPFVLHHLGDTQFGILVLVGSVIAQGAHLDLGIRSAVTKFVAEHHARGEMDHLRSLVATALWLYCFLGLIGLLLTVLISPVLPSLFNVPPSDRGTMVTVALLMGVQLSISIPCSTAGAVLCGLQRYALNNAISVVWTILSAVATVAILLAGGGIVEISAVAIPITLIMQVVTVFCIYRIAPDLHFGWRGARREFIKSVLSFSTSMLAIDVAYSLQTKTDEIVIGAFLPISLVSPYSIARRLSGLPQLVAERFLWAFLPLSSQLHAEGEAERLRSLYLTGTRITLAICVPLIAVVVTMAGPLLTLWVGEQYAKYAPITVVLALASVLEVSSWPGGTILQGLARHHGIAVMSICAALANLALSIVLIRPFGLIGVAIGTLLPTAILTFGWKVSYSMRILQVRPQELLKHSLLPVLWPSLLMTGFLFGVTRESEPSHLLTIGCTAAVGLLIFVVAYLGLFSGESERQLIRSASAAFRRRLNTVEE